jgi:hypothetical protein
VSTLAVVEDVLRKARIPLSVPQIVTRARGGVPPPAKRPDLVVARDLALSLRRLGDESPFARTAPGRFTLRERIGDDVYEARPQQRGGWRWTPRNSSGRVRCSVERAPER